VLVGSVRLNGAGAVGVGRSWAGAVGVGRRAAGLGAGGCKIEGGLTPGGISKPGGPWPGTGGLIPGGPGMNDLSGCR